MNHLLHRTPKLGILTRAYWNGATSFETFYETALLLWTAISIDWYSLQNCWQPNFIHVMLKSRCRKISEARSRSWRRTFYLRLRNPAKEKKNSFTTFLVNYSVWSKANILAKGSFANMFLTFFRFFKVNLEMGKVIMLQKCWWDCKVATWMDRRFQDFRNLGSVIKIPFEIDVESAPIDVQIEQLFLTVGARLPGGNQ